MSASLVGSEMCIRDRGWSCSAFFTSRRRAPLRGLARPLRTPGRSWTSAVSYTHLTLPTICSV
eukprot:12159216-Alexandrium_andersonii.AAC.1